MKATLTIENIDKGGTKATLETIPERGSCIFTEKYIVTGYEKRHADTQARRVAALLDWNIEE